MRIICDAITKQSAAMGRAKCPISSKTPIPSMLPMTTALPMPSASTKTSTIRVAVKNSGAATNVTETRVRIRSKRLPGNIAAVMPSARETGTPISAVSTVTATVFW